MTAGKGKSIRRWSSAAVGGDENRELLLDVWREVASHQELAESADIVAAMLEGHLPLRCLLLRRFEAQGEIVNTLATGQAGRESVHATAKTVVAPGKWKRLLAWAKEGKVLSASAGVRDGEAAFLVPEELAGDVLAGPLAGPEGPAGVIVCVASKGISFTETHAQLVRALLEPFAVALENERRLHELITLREAAEADRRSLLTRLGKQEINEAVVGSDTGLKHVMERVQMVAKSDVPVLILGETGTGKEVVSRAIHTRSARANGPFIRVNCGAIPPELVDSQLFGHEKGSFTGAADTRPGWFERADGGTLFLDEMGELPLPAQVRLLRVLQDGLVERVGGQQSIRVDVRIIAATHRDLAAMVKAGAFREDLWYRINVFPILLPRLRERREDIPALARHFARGAATRFGLSYAEPTPADLNLLMNYSWPGNIRELGAVIDRAAIIGGGKQLEVALALGLARPVLAAPVSAEPTFYEVVPEVVAPLATPLATGEGETVVSLDAAMRRHIERALVATRGRIEGRHGAAALLKINPHTLRARMRKLGVEWDKFRGV